MSPMNTVLWLGVLVLAKCYTTFAASVEQWQSRSIYQVVTDRFARSDGSTTAQCNAAQGQYCGGTWEGLMNNLDYIQDMGFTAVWISPTNRQEERRTADLGSYHGYWQNSLYDLNPHFGTPDDLTALAAALHSRNMYLMVDIVVNDFAWAGNGTTVDYSTFNPFNEQSYFHPFELLNEDTSGNSTAAQTDWIGDDVMSLPDLRTEDNNVAAMFQQWIAQFVSNYSVDGLRIDSVLNVNLDFFPPFADAAGTFLIGEVFNGDPVSACRVQEDMDGILNFPYYFYGVRAFNSTSGNLTALAEQMGNIANACKNVFALGTFSENHDMPRFASFTSDPALAQNMLAFDIMMDGIPIVYYGQEQHLSGAFNPVNREALWLTGYPNSSPLYQTISSLNKVRNHAMSVSDTYPTFVTNIIHLDNQTLVLRKGDKGNQTITVLANLGSASQGVPTLQLLNTDFDPEQEVIEVLGCQITTVMSDGTLSIDMNGGEPKVFYPYTMLNGSGLCGYSGPQQGGGNGSSTTGGGGSGNSTGGNGAQKNGSAANPIHLPYAWIWTTVALLLMVQAMRV